MYSRALYYLEWNSGIEPPLHDVSCHNRDWVRFYASNISKLHRARPHNRKSGHCWHGKQCFSQRYHNLQLSWCKTHLHYMYIYPYLTSERLKNLWNVIFNFEMFQVKVGMLLNLIGSVVIVVASHTWGMYFFGFDKIPWELSSSTEAAFYSESTFEYSQAHNLNMSLYPVN